VRRPIHVAAVWKRCSGSFVWREETHVCGVSIIVVWMTADQVTCQ
jgi:hypothetical protein